MHNIKPLLVIIVLRMYVGMFSVTDILNIQEENEEIKV